ncbi:T6SS immunity protein Tli4 family protein [Pseudomonas sp. V104_6]|uniref:T6SS immunity protein Tli4 family protein n=1 Tax=Pseudomonas sp. V104_6 TaxID=3044230 RepID=UPI00249DA049|nr:T6SS immunity protein Tli4 family protein [Pseudomonas sp. V104_6]MDI3373051.1 T6SS immunity protein Tli4 family protein [Pseudomonas sp. V104_6]
MDLTFGTPLSQSGRLLQLATPLGTDQLQALRAHGVERIGRTPRYTLDVLVQDTEYDPEKLIGQLVSLALLCDSAEAEEEKLITWGDIVWESDWVGWEDPQTLSITSDDYTGNIELGAGRKFTFGPKLPPGDGTVPVSSSASSRAFPNVRAAFAHGKNSREHPSACRTGAYNRTTGYEHQNAYNDPYRRTLYATLYSTVRFTPMLNFDIYQNLTRTLKIVSVVAIVFSSTAESGAIGMNTQKNTFYFGRYSISAPTDGSGIWTSYKIIQKDLQFISKNGKRDINIKVDDSIAEINTLHKAGYKAFDQKIPLDGGGVIVVSKSTNYDFDIYYLTSNNTLYRQTVESISIDAFDKAVGLAKDLNSMIHSRYPNSNIPEGTFAIDAGYLTLPLDKYPEQVSIGLPISTIPGIHVIFDTQVIRKPEPGLIERYEQRTAGSVTPMLHKILTSSTLLRKTKRTIAGLKFEELLLKTSANDRNFYSFRLEYPGTPKSSREPYTVLEMSTLDEGDNFNNDEDALKFWDTLVDSMKPI